VAPEHESLAVEVKAVGDRAPVGDDDVLPFEPAARLDLRLARPADQRHRRLAGPERELHRRLDGPLPCVVENTRHVVPPVSGQPMRSV